MTGLGNLKASVLRYVGGPTCSQYHDLLVQQLRGPLSPGELQFVSGRDPDVLCSRSVCRYFFSPTWLHMR